MTAANWADAKAIVGTARVTLGPQASQQWLHAPEHLAMVLSRYRAAAALIGDAADVVELGCGEGIGVGILAKGRASYYGVDNDDDALALAHASYVSDRVHFRWGNILSHVTLSRGSWDAVVALDVLEHLPAEREDDVVQLATALLVPDTGILVLGTPNARFDDLASPQSQAGHVNTYTHDRLYALMSRYFYVVQSFGLQDTSLHLGHPDARHYLLMAGIGPR
jgi:2-polyprenyl-3-methyl-5-hydroxy-6-metoxy-1,4-benzoquinol methylase